MKWHAFNIDRGLSLPYRRIPKAVRADHGVLLLYCAKQENNGIIRDGGTFTEADWLILGFGKAEIDGLVEHGLARALPREVADLLVAQLTPTEEQAAREGFDWEWCRITGEAIDAACRSTSSDRVKSIDRLLADRVEVDRSTSTGCAVDRKSIDLCVVDFDLGGQIRAQRLAETNRKRAEHRWLREKQQELFPASSPPAPPPKSIDPIESRSIDPPASAAAYATAVHSNSNRSEKPPQPPLAGGRSIEPSPADRPALGDFWTWLLGARPAGLNSAAWGGGRRAAFRAIASKGVEQGLGVPELLVLLRADLGRKFRDAKWVNDWALSRRGFRSYVRDDDWLSPLPDPARSPAPATPAEDKAAAADRYVVALLKDPGVDDDQKREAKRRWLEQNPGRTPPWGRPS